MIDTYTMILWAKANNNKIDTQTKQVLDILSTLSRKRQIRTCSEIFGVLL